MNVISSIQESPCSKCPYTTQCDILIKNNNSFVDIWLNIFRDKNKSYKDCSIYNAVNINQKMSKKKKKGHR